MQAHDAAVLAVTDPGGVRRRPTSPKEETGPVVPGLCTKPLTCKHRPCPGPAEAPAAARQIPRRNALQVGFVSYCLSHVSCFPLGLLWERGKHKGCTWLVAVLCVMQNKSLAGCAFLLHCFYW